MGCFATLFMDLSARFLIKSKVVRPTVGPEVPGRWALYMLKGKFTHQDIDQTPPLRNEVKAASLSHYLIGIALAGFYLLLEMWFPAIQGRLWAPLLFGLATVLFPWLWLYPAIGIGFLASKSPRQTDFIVLSCVNHLDFGIGMAIWVALFHRFFG
ncbi:MAG: DUF2938 domain-containing protein [Desulfarculaceae bacterium]|nr:DUF2938 domain-containing protein [Desulfarculaceae bacterium]MCF8072737.1 DUF2938 domain-containing protein [Desulfarculaceae bacterium]MCF8103029.1 DUF2938 domain-containing protein [Desulfarculaceae bacterium]MCF8118106.1 DUF2938 domain-containing protein [Desulfarculaceae bacterium]